MAKIIDGKKIAAEVRADIKRRANEIEERMQKQMEVSTSNIRIFSGLRFLKAKSLAKYTNS